MAEYYDVSDPETVKLWSKDLWTEHRKSDTLFDPKHGFVGEDWTQSPFILIDDAAKSAGDRVRTPFMFQLSGRGVIGDQVLEGKEESPTTSTFDVLIDEQINGVRTRGRMTNQRVTFKTMEEAKILLKDWWRTRRAVCAVNHLCGYTAQTDLAYTGLNAVSVPDTQHIYRAKLGLGLGLDETVGADNTSLFDVNYIEELTTIAEQLTPAIAPFVIGGNPYYGILLHPNVVTDMRDNNTQWYAAMQAALQGGFASKNPIFSRALGMWRNCLVFSEPHITRGVHSALATPVANTRRCVFFGAGCLQLAYGRHNPGNDDHFQWYSGSWDHGRKYFASAGLVRGIKGVRFTVDGTARDYGKIVLTVYSADRVAGVGDIGQVV